MWCIVNLPNGTQQAVKWDPKAIGQECLEKVGRINKSNLIIFFNTIDHRFFLLIDSFCGYKLN